MARDIPIEMQTIHQFGREYGAFRRLVLKPIPFD
jgi:hypothetical protein